MPIAEKPCALVRSAALDGRPVAVRPARLPADHHPAPCGRAVDWRRARLLDHPRVDGHRDGHVPRLAGDDRHAAAAAAARCARWRCSLAAGAQHHLRPHVPGLDRRPFRRRLAVRCRPISAAPIRSTLNYILVFGVNMILFHVNYARRAGITRSGSSPRPTPPRTRPSSRRCATSSTRISCSIRSTRSPP